jgi:hypothetical protein
MADHKQLVELRNWIVDNLDREQTSFLSADLGVDYDGLAGGSEGAKALHLIGHLQRRGRIDELFQAVDRIRADPSLLGASSSGLPTRCPSCNAPLLPDEIEWFNPSLARCAYCGTPVRAQGS